LRLSIDNPFFLSLFSVSSPLTAGQDGHMPILQCSKTKQVFVIKRIMNTGYAGVDNLLYYMDNCSLVFGDAKEVVEELVLSIKGS